jgi:hypothetical protein
MAGEQIHDEIALRRTSGGNGHTIRVCMRDEHRVDSSQAELRKPFQRSSLESFTCIDDDGATIACQMGE